MMGFFPALVEEYLHRVLIQERNPAFLVTDLSGVLLEVGGNLSIYGLQNLKTGIALSTQVDFVEGLLPLESQELSLPCVEIAPQRFADIHLFRHRDQNRECILLVDVTSAEVQQGLLQQKANDLHLLRNHYSHFLELLRSLDMVLLRKKDDLHFDLIGKPPDWIEHCGLRMDDDGNCKIASPTEFLYNFANAAEESPENSERSKSGPWVETAPDGNEWYFEATAIRSGKEKIIFIERVAPYSDSRFAMLQKAREQSLEYLKLSRKEKALREKESRTRILLNAVPDWIFKINRDGIILDLKATMGKNPSIFAEFIGQPLQEIFPEDAARKMIQSAEEAFRTHSLSTCVFPIGPDSSFQFEARVVAISMEEAVLLVRDLPRG